MYLSAFCLYSYVLIGLSLGNNELENQKSYDLKDYLHLLRDGVWQHVGYNTNKFFVYSAFLERRQQPSVRIIAAKRRRLTDDVLCKLLLPNNRTVTLNAHIQIVREHSYKRYSAAFIICPLPTDNSDTKLYPKEIVGSFVAIVLKNKPHYPPFNLLRVLDTIPKYNQETLHICVKPLHSSFSRKDWLIEWLEMNLILGVSHFYLYNESMSSHVSCVLKYYVNNGLVTLLPWKMLFPYKEAVRLDFAALNDCLYRSMVNAAWLLVIDADELVIPRHHSTLIDLVTHSNTTSKLAQLLFRNVYFFTQWKVFQDDVMSEYPLLMSQKTRRIITPDKVFIRSKYAVRPQHAYELGTNFAWSMREGSETRTVSSSKGLLHHYRVLCEDDNYPYLLQPSRRDRITSRWMKYLSGKVAMRRQRFDQICSEILDFTYN